MRPWTQADKEELARVHIEYEVRKLVECVEELRRLGPASVWISSGSGVAGQAVLDASLMHLRNLHEFLHPRPMRSDWAWAGLYSDSWIARGFLGPSYGRVSAKV